jgi:hypothetical protein
VPRRDRCAPPPIAPPVATSADATRWSVGKSACYREVLAQLERFAPNDGIPILGVNGPTKWGRNRDSYDPCSAVVHSFVIPKGKELVPAPKLSEVAV